MIKIIKLLRPKQWIKNLLVFAALFFSKNIFDTGLVLDVLSGFVIFCMVSSSVYIINDTIDRDKDRQHPKKCKRPIASGAITVPKAMTLLVVMLVLEFSWAYKLNVAFCVIAMIYFLINIVYSLKLKQIPIIDIMVIATGFVLRAVAGGVLISDYISPWLIVCTLLLSLFLALHKRKSEVQNMQGNKELSRAVLTYYTEEMLRDMLSMISSTTIMAYCLYTFTSQQSTYLMLTIPFVIYGMFRYQFIMHRTELGESPELALLKDKPLLIDVLLWVISCGGILYLM